MGSVDAHPLDEAMEHPDRRGEGNAVKDSQGRFRDELIVVLVAAVVFLGCAIGPPSLMDDVDAVQAQIARNMLDSGDWVTARLDGVAYLEKPPLKYWSMAVCYMIFGVHDWAARIPMALFAVALCWLTARIGWWAFGGRTGFYAGLTLATCAGRCGTFLCDCIRDVGVFSGAGGRRATSAPLGLDHGGEHRNRAAA
jgi:hypothetical protein